MSANAPDFSSPPVEKEETASTAPASPLVLITGFLGSGKTTLINRLLRAQARVPGLPKLGIVVNEFGQVGIDGALLSGPGILELANGCVCCAKGVEMWESALELVDRAGAEVLLVETSGLVEPEALLAQYELLPRPLARRIDLRGLVCLVDVAHAHAAVARRREARHQIEHADRVLLTKLDLSPPSELPGVLLAAHRLLDELGACSERVSLAADAPDADVATALRWMLSPQKRRRRRPARVQTDGDCGHAHAPGEPCLHGLAEPPHGGRQLIAVSIREPEPLLAEPLERVLRELPGDVLRAKGFVRVVESTAARQTALFPEVSPPPEARLKVLHLAGRRVELQPADAQIEAAAPSGSTLVFIGEDLDETWLRLRLSACRLSSRSDAADPARTGAEPRADSTLPSESANFQG